MNEQAAWAGLRARKRRRHALGALGVPALSRASASTSMPDRHLDGPRIPSASKRRK
jgi:hypothetical protein